MKAPFDSQPTIRQAALVLLVAALGSVGASPALAADRAVSVTDNAFTDARVAVTPGETVTWTAPTSALNPHNVAFEDGLLISPSLPAPGPWATSRTFGSAGTFPYHCQIHGRPGGLGMAGIVYVNAAGNMPPTAALTTSPRVPQPGQSVSFNAAGSSDVDGTLTHFDWDLDGDGTFETSTGATPTTSSTYATAGLRTVRLRVTDNNGAAHETTETLRVNSQPSASFRISPNPAPTGTTVTFDGSDSSDPDGSVARFEWDLDGDGSFESDSGGTPAATRSYQVGGTTSVGLRVTDRDGGKGEARRSLQITARPPVVPPGGIGLTAPRLALSSKSIPVDRSGGFSVSFGATPGTSGSMTLQSAAKVNLGALRRISLGTKSFTVTGSARAKVRWRLSRRNLRILKRKSRIRFRATVTIRNAAGVAASDATMLVLRMRGRPGA